MHTCSRLPRLSVAATQEHKSWTSCADEAAVLCSCSRVSAYGLHCVLCTAADVQKTYPWELRWLQAGATAASSDCTPATEAAALAVCRLAVEPVSLAEEAVPLLLAAAVHLQLFLVWVPADLLKCPDDSACMSAQQTTHNNDLSKAPRQSAIGASTQGQKGCVHLRGMCPCCTALVLLHNKGL